MYTNVYMHVCIHIIYTHTVVPADFRISNTGWDEIAQLITQVVVCSSIAVCCSVLQVVVCCSIAVYCSVLQVVVCCSVAVCCSVLQCVL